MSNLATMHLKCLLEQATPGPWTVEDDGYDIIVGNAEGHRMGWGDQVRFKFEAGDKKHDTALAALAPELAQEVLRMRRELKSMQDAWLRMAGDSDRTPTEQNLAERIVDHIRTVLRDHHDE